MHVRRHRHRRRSIVAAAASAEGGDGGDQGTEDERGCAGHATWVHRLPAGP